MMKKNGFTLIELMVVIAIIGILLSMGAGFVTGVNLELTKEVEEQSCDGKHVYGDGSCD